MAHRMRTHDSVKMICKIHFTGVAVNRGNLTLEQFFFSSHVHTISDTATNFSPRSFQQIPTPRIHPTLLRNCR